MTFTETPDSIRREHRLTARLHAEDCAALGITEGSTASLGNERGEVLVHAAIHEGQQRGVSWYGGLGEAGLIGVSRKRRLNLAGELGVRLGEESLRPPTRAVPSDI